MQRLLLVGLFLIGATSYAQNLKVSEEILKELETVVITSEIDTFTFRVKYPKNFDSEKEYKCLLGLSGGDQSMKVVNYCYPAYFKSGYFDNYITVLPVATPDTLNFKEFDASKIERMLHVVNENFRLLPNWLIVGTSNGGKAAFNFVAAFPEKFEGLIVVPGRMDEKITPNTDWSHLKTVIAYGTKDYPLWVKEAKSTKKRLNKMVKSYTLLPLKGQGHILPISFNVDNFYDVYFLNN